MCAQKAPAQEALDAFMIESAKILSKVRLECSLAGNELAASMGGRMAEAMEAADLQRRQEVAQAAKLRDAAIQVRQETFGTGQQSCGTDS